MAPTTPTSSASTPIVAVRARPARRASFAALTISLVTSTSRMPASTNAAASSTFWQQMPTAPSATCRFAISGTLVRLGVRPQCHGRSAHGVGHQFQVALEWIEIDDQRRRLDGRHGIAGPRGHALHRFLRLQMIADSRLHRRAPSRRRREFSDPFACLQRCGPLDEGGGRRILRWKAIMNSARNRLRSCVMRPPHGHGPVQPG